MSSIMKIVLLLFISLLCSCSINIKQDAELCLWHDDCDDEEAKDETDRE